MNNRILVALLAGAAVLALPGCQQGEASVVEDAASPPPAPLPVELALPSTQDMEAAYDATAPLSADREALIPARAAGEVVEILVEEGQRVVAGQTLARLDGELARLEMLKAQADFERARREHERSRRLRERGLVSAAAHETQQYVLAALEATYELKRLAHQHTTIRATIPGVVAERYVKVGYRVEQGAPAFRVTDTSRLVAELKIPQRALGTIGTGQDALITVDALPGSSFIAAVDRISPTIDADTGSFRATIYIDNRDGRLAPGMFGRVSIAYEKHAGARVVPTRALIREDEEVVLYVVRDGVALRRPVQVGIENAGMTEILEGLAADEPVVVTGQGGLRDGSEVLASNDPRVDG